ncbi:flavodoxin [Clostridium fermenticellae]|uniref:Flavodoxin n=1 Tax=Clostridium fermenticellae TaxID=2068654 RepID=A0A386H540_9CLOT|nr:flavodoxin [Clostridium fermenticellae]AYD40867.1 flavodoxin [Clostridium fermenticellae]
MKKVNIIYWSGTGNTEAMASLISEGAKEDGAEVKLLNVSEASNNDITEADIVILGSPAMGDEVVEESEMQPFIDSAAETFKGKKVALFGSYGWGSGKWMEDWTEKMHDDYGAEVLNDGLIVNGAPEGDSEEECKEFGKKLLG